MADNVYVLLRTGVSASVVSVHTTQQGAAMEMAGKTPNVQRQMWVECSPLVDDDDA